MTLWFFLVTRQNLQNYGESYLSPQLGLQEAGAGKEKVYCMSMSAECNSSDLTIEDALVESKKHALTRKGKTRNQEYASCTLQDCIIMRKTSLGFKLVV